MALLSLFSRNHKKRTVPAIQLWDEVIHSFLKRNDSFGSTVRHNNFYMDFNGWYSGSDNVSYLYVIDKYPQELDIGFRTIIRSECRDGVRISFVSQYDKFQIQWNSAQMKSKLRTWRTLDDDTKDVDAYDLHSNLATLDSQAWRRESLEYLSTAEIRRNRRNFEVYSCMIISGKRGDAFNDTVKGVEFLCKNRGIVLRRIRYNIQDYLSALSPFSGLDTAGVRKSVSSNVVTDEILARFSSFTQGKVGIRGLYWGTDIHSSFPCLKPFKITSQSAENILITAETGGGKSFLVKCLILQILADPLFVGTVMDIEGFEYLSLASFMVNFSNCVVLNMAEGVGAYYDPMEIYMTGDKELDKDMFTLSSSYTISYIKTLLGNSAKNEWIDAAIEDAVGSVYRDAGVIEEDMDTWKNSKGYSLFDVYARIKSMYENYNGDNIERKRALELCNVKLSRYFEKDGIRSGLFKQRITLASIVSAKLVVCSFGMAGKNEKSIDKVQLALMQLSAAIISHLRSVFSKHNGKYNFKLWEEFQRWGSFPDSDKTIGTALTGGRKLGDVNIIITNAVQKILDNDKFDIFNNITTFAIGCIVDSKTRAQLCERLSIPQMQCEIDEIADKTKEFLAYREGDNVSDSPYCKAFLLGLDRTVYPVAKVVLNKDLAESELFSTGVNTSANSKSNNEEE